LPKTFKYVNIYVHKNKYSFMNFDTIVLKILEIYTASSAFGVLLMLMLIFIIWAFLKFLPLSKVSLCFEVMYEKAYDFFSEILEEGFSSFAKNYVPVFGKWYISVEKGSVNKYLYYPLAFFAKAFDILISMFLAFLEIIGVAAKIVSLSFRLFGNMTSGTVLLGMVVVGMSALTAQWTGFIWGFNFPVILPILVYLQEILKLI